jgi:hypothetical protein
MILKQSSSLAVRNETETPKCAPVVEVPDLWLKANCSGWQISRSGKGAEAQWIAPFVSFILPSVVFSKSSHNQCSTKDSRSTGLVIPRS